MTNDLPGSNGKMMVGAVLRSKAKTVHFIRHAEGTHNEAARTEGRAAYSKIEHMDARLTDKGKDQCRNLKAVGHGIQKEAQLVVVSPLTRAIQTALLTLDQVDRVPWMALECARERAGGHYCDKRRALSVLKEEFPSINWQEVKDEEDVYWENLGGNRETDEAMKERAFELFRWIKERPETNIVVVTHSAFLSCMLNKAVSCSPELSKWFENCEARTVLLDV
ncbi:unnamed protein product [Discosporangium mesarthrocarpum]